MKPKILVILSFLLTISCTRELDVTRPNTPSGNFDAFWTTIDTRYCFHEEKAVDWNHIYDLYKPRVDTLDRKQERELFAVMAECIDYLKDGHVNLYAPFDVSRSDSWWKGYPGNFNNTLLYSKYMPDYQTAGGLYYSRIAADSVGLIRYSSFSSTFSALNMIYVLNYFSDCKGLIIDVRNNGGGDIENAYRLAATFFSDNRLIGYWNHKTGSDRQAFSELEPLRVDTADMPCRWLRRVVVLCNRQTYSAANLFVSMMRYADNCLIVGGLTGGGGGMPLSYELPNGWTLRFSAVKMYDADKKSIEDGIMPDAEVTLLSTDKDDLIEYAVEKILEAY